MWIKTRMYYSKCMLNDKDNIDDAIKGYREIAYKENFWFYVPQVITNMF